MSTILLEMLACPVACHICKLLPLLHPPMHWLSLALLCSGSPGVCQHPSKPANYQRTASIRPTVISFLIISLYHAAAKLSHPFRWFVWQILHKSHFTSCLTIKYFIKTIAFCCCVKYLSFHQSAAEMTKLLINLFCQVMEESIWNPSTTIAKVLT